MTKLPQENPLIAELGEEYERIATGYKPVGLVTLKLKQIKKDIKALEEKDSTRRKNMETDTKLVEKD